MKYGTITYILNLLDLAMTTLWVKRFGVDIEANPIGRWLYETGAVYAVKVFGIGAALALIYMLARDKPYFKLVSWGVLAVYAALAVYHLVIAVKVFM